MLDDVLDKENAFVLLYEPDDVLRKQWEKDDLVIYQANPVAVNNQEVFESIKDLRSMAVLYENKRENFLCKHCNIMYKGLGVEGYVDIQKVKRCRIEEDPAWWKGRRVYVGLDLAQTDDNTAVSMVTEDNGKIRAKVWGILPKDRVEIKSQKENVDYKKLIAAGNCFAEGEEVIDYGFVERLVMSLEETFGVEIVQIGYDRYNAISTVQKLEAAGYECVEVKQHSSVLHPPTKLLREVSLLDKTPANIATSVETRDDGDILVEYRVDEPLEEGIDYIRQTEQTTEAKTTTLTPEDESVMSCASKTIENYKMKRRM